MAKSLQSCPTLCDPIDGSPPGSTVPEILQARTLEWAAISFSNAWKWKVKGKSLSRVRLFATPWTAAYQAPPSMGLVLYIITLARISLSLDLLYSIHFMSYCSGGRFDQYLNHQLSLRIKDGTNQPSALSSHEWFDLSTQKEGVTILWEQWLWKA